jgi:hypothetical protein
MVDAPPRRLTKDDPVSSLTNLQRKEGIEIGPRINHVRWTGEDLDLDWAMVALRN